MNVHLFTYFSIEVDSPSGSYEPIILSKVNNDFSMDKYQTKQMVFIRNSEPFLSEKFVSAIEQNVV